jgi:hypothetical protein
VPGPLRQKAGKDLPHCGLMLDLFAIADDPRHGHSHRIKSGAAGVIERQGKQ